MKPAWARPRQTSLSRPRWGFPAGPLEVTALLGFTLIERARGVLAIVAIGMAAVLGALTSSASTVLYMRDKTSAQWVVLNHIAPRNSGCKTHPDRPQPVGNSDGDVDYAGSKWHWRQVEIRRRPPSRAWCASMDVMVRPAMTVKADNDHGWHTSH